MKPVTSRDEYIMQSLHAASPMLQNFAIRYNEDFIELYQQAALIAFGCYENALSKQKPRAYIHAYINGEIRRLYAAHPSYSLDRPCVDSEEEMYQDRLVAPSHIGSEDTMRADQRINALYEALKRLPMEEQLYLQEIYGLHAFEPVAQPGREPNYSRSRPALCKDAYRRLRRDAALMQALAL